MASIAVAPSYAKARRAILKGLIGHNRQKLGRIPWKQIALTLNEGEAVVGGIAGEVWAGWLFIQLLWIDESQRGQDHGSALLTRLENEARAFGARHAYVDTFSFQAPGFYQKHGYGVFGTLEDYPAGHQRFWLTKAL